MTSATPSEPATIGSSTTARILGLSHRAVLDRVKAGTLTPHARLEGRTGAYIFSRAYIEALADRAEQPEAAS